jgi:serine protease Do
MMRKKLLTGVVLMMMAGSCLFGQIRNFIPIVHPVYSQKTIDFLNSLSDSMRGRGYDEIADMFKAYSAGCYGSGFVYVTSAGSNYVITNYHVVAEADSVTLEFEKEDGIATVYKNCAIIAFDESLDLAIISFPDAKRPFQAGLVLSTGYLNDGQEVWTAGYPGLISKPMWQLGKGNITNARAKVPELIDPEISALIQHSAQVDAGNSGGPLLIADWNGTSGYKVIGINTWKIVGRQATNFSIPSVLVQNFLNKMRLKNNAGETGKNPSVLEKRCREFIEALTSKEKPYKKAMYFISNEYILRNGEHAVNEVLSKAPTQVCNEIIAAFARVSPFNGIRMAAAYYIFMNVGKNEALPSLTFTAVDWNADKSPAATPVRFTVLGQEINSTWVFEHDLWNLSAFPFIKEKNADTNKGEAIVTIESPYHFLLSGGALLDFNSITTPTWDVGVYYSIIDYIFMGTEFGIRSVTATDFFSGTEQVLILEMHQMLRLQLPIKTKILVIIPYASIGLHGMINTNPGYSDLGGFFLVGGGGIQLAFGEEPQFLIGCEYLANLANIMSFGSNSSKLSVYIALCL